MGTDEPAYNSVFTSTQWGCYHKLKMQLREAGILRPEIEEEGFAGHVWRRSIITHLAHKGYSGDFQSWFLRHSPGRDKMRLEHYLHIEGEVSQWHNPSTF